MTPLRVLVTRPQHLAEEYCVAFAKQGWQPVRLPFLTITPLRCETPLVADVVIFISANAVINVDLTTLPAGQTVIAMGLGTQHALTQKGVESCTSQAPYTSESVLAMPELQDVQGKLVLIVAGEGGRDALLPELQARGAHVTKLVVYRRDRPEVNTAILADFFKQADRVITITSLQTLENCVASVPEGLRLALWATPLVVVSERIANGARQYPFKTVRVSESVQAKDVVMAIHQVVTS